jgi:thiosulfate reductase cytochrome b subunit
MKVLLDNWRKIIHIVLLIIILLYIISGLGMLYYQIFELISFGVLTKILLYKIHTYLLIPFLIFLFAHIFLVWRKNEN